MSSEALEKNISWHHELEEYFSHTGEKASCLSYLHKKSEQRYSTTTMWIDLPVIILSVLNGAVSVGSNTLFGGSEFASVGVGAVALLTGILNALGSYFSWSRRSEAHKISAINYAKLYRFLSIEMSLPREERMTPADLLKYVKTEYDRLQEISPLIPPAIINDFRTRFGDLKDVSFPEEANGLHPITIYKEDPTLRAVLSNIQMRENDSVATQSPPSPNPNYII
jgi:hypothetical protein